MLKLLEKLIEEFLDEHDLSVSHIRICLIRDNSARKVIGALESKGGEVSLKRLN